MVQKIINCLIIKNKEKSMKCKEEHGIIVKSANKTIPEQIQEIVSHTISPKELKVLCITDNE